MDSLIYQHVRMRLILIQIPIKILLRIPVLPCIKQSLTERTDLNFLIRLIMLII